MNINDFKNEQGQISFAAAVFFDKKLKPERKETLLAACLDLPDEAHREEARRFYDWLCRTCGEPDCPGDYAHYE